MAEKTDKPEGAAPEGAPAAEAAPAKSGGIGAMIPLIVALVVAPVLSWAVAEFVLLPRITTQVAAAVGGGAGVAESHAAAGGESHAAEPKHEAKKPKAEGGHGGGEGAAEEGPESYRFEDVVVNLSGTMGTRYLKASFLVSGKDNLRELFEGRKAQLLDATLNTLGSLTLVELEEVGSRNLIRARLIAAYNEILGVRVVEQIYFSDFVIQ